MVREPSRQSGDDRRFRTFLRSERHPHLATRAPLRQLAHALSCAAESFRRLRAVRPGAIAPSFPPPDDRAGDNGARLSAEGCGLFNRALVPTRDCHCENLNERRAVSLDEAAMTFHDCSWRELVRWEERGTYLFVLARS